MIDTKKKTRTKKAGRRETMPRAVAVLRQGSRAFQDLGLLKVLQSELTHESSSLRFQDAISGSLGQFAVVWDSPDSKDVVLRRKCESGEEVAVSALLGPESYGGEGLFPRDVSMKVCVKKPSLSSILQFDCGVLSGGSDFEIRNAFYLPMSTSLGLGSSIYRGPLFSTLDPDLQVSLKEYLISRGIGESLTNFLLLHLHKKEQAQYVNWLHKLQDTIAQGE